MDEGCNQGGDGSAGHPVADLGEELAVIRTRLTDNTTKEVM